MANHRIIMVRAPDMTAADRQRRLAEAFDRLWGLAPEKATADGRTLAKMPPPAVRNADTLKRISAASLS